jgi:hypothetical protein
MTTPTTTTFSWNKHDWASLSEMADGFDEYRPAHSRTLDGQELTVCCRYVDSAEEFTLIQTFRDGELDWTIDGAAGAHSGTETYGCSRCSPVCSISTASARRKRIPWWSAPLSI